MQRKSHLDPKHSQQGRGKARGENSFSFSTPQKNSWFERFSSSLTIGQPFQWGLMAKETLASDYSHNSKCSDQCRNASHFNCRIGFLVDQPIKEQFIHIRIFIIATLFTWKLWWVTKMVCEYQIWTVMQAHIFGAGTLGVKCSWNSSEAVTQKFWSWKTECLTLSSLNWSLLLKGVPDLAQSWFKQSEKTYLYSYLWD